MKTAPVTDLKLDPETLAVYTARARRARAEAVQSLVARFFGKLSARITSSAGHPFGVRWG